MCLVRWMTMTCLMLSLAACESKLSSQTLSKTLEAQGEDGVILLAPGSEPRQKLRYAFVPGWKESWVLEAQMSMTQDTGGEKAPAINPPATLVTLDVAAKSVSAEGDLRYEYRVIKADVRPDGKIPDQVITALIEELKPIVGVEGWVVISAQGVRKDSGFNASGLSVKHSRLLEGLTDQTFRCNVLPAVEVGQGAQWRYKEMLEKSRAKIAQTTVYTLDEFKGGRGTASISITQHGDTQDLSLPQEEKKAVLTSLEGSGSGTLTINLSRPIWKADFTLKVATDISLNSPTGEKNVKTSVKSDFKLYAATKEPN